LKGASEKKWWRFRMVQVEIPKPKKLNVILVVTGIIHWLGVESMYILQSEASM